MKFRNILVIFIILPNVFLTGCWNSREINSLAIAVCIGIDKNENGYLVTHQVLNPKVIATKEASQDSPVILYSDTGKDIFEIFRKLTTQSPRKIYLSHLRMVVFGENVAKEGIQNIIDFFSRDHEFRTDFYFVVAKSTTAKDVLSILTPLETIPGDKMYESIKTSEKSWSPTKTITTIELMNSISADGKNPVLTGIQITDGTINSNSTDALKQSNTIKILKYTSLGVFKKDKLVGWLNESESKGYNYITDNIKNSVGYVDYGDKAKITCEIKDVKSKIKVSLINDKPAIDVYVNVKQNVGGIEGEFDVTKEENINLINELAEAKVKLVCEESLRKAQNELETDIFGFGEAIHRKYPKLWDQIKNNWNDEFLNLPIRFSIKVKTNHTGRFTKPFYMKE